MRVLVVGSGGREHALIELFSRSPFASEVLAVPGRDGFHPAARSVRGEGSEPADILAVAEREDAALTVVGPEAPLVAGIVDLFESRSRSIFGPSAKAARLEGSKVFAKEVLESSGVPTARCRVARSLEEARRAIGELGPAVAVKADGLAAGKGVVLARSEAEAEEAARLFLEERSLGRAGEALLIEEFLVGEELSILALARGVDFELFPASRDYKRIGDGGTGPNTGGMGAISPVPGVDGALLDRIRGAIFQPVLRTMAASGAPYRGILYAGVLLTHEGPKVLEFNCRFGDPETQAVLPLVDEDLLPRFEAVARGGWIPGPIRTAAGAAACVVLAAPGYPERSAAGIPIEGLEEPPLPGASRLHAGTARRDGRWVTAGGRVLNIVARGETLPEALDLAYREADRVRFKGKQCRRDIGKPGVQG
ncbi:MAG: phosphoribosylamine--glycine ligase [Candidatus Latescibacterota bacterium]|nr:MAG: phosphoribosylamine--glycine ligase [Candidatus Latescibacterota bacterium]